MKLKLAQLRQIIREEVQRHRDRGKIKIMENDDFSVLDAKTVLARWPEALDAWTRLEKSAGRGVSDSVFTTDVSGRLFVEPPVASGPFVWIPDRGQWVDEGELDDE